MVNIPVVIGVHTCQVVVWDFFPSTVLVNFMCFELGGIKDWLVFFCSDHWKQNKQRKQGLLYPLVSFNKAVLNPYFWGGRLTSHETIFPQLTASNINHSPHVVCSLNAIYSTQVDGRDAHETSRRKRGKHGEVCIGWVEVYFSWPWPKIELTHCPKELRFPKKIHPWKP